MAISIREDFNHILRKCGVPDNIARFSEVNPTDTGLAGTITEPETGKEIPFSFFYQSAGDLSQLAFPKEASFLGENEFHIRSHLKAALMTPTNRARDLTDEQVRQIETIEDLACKIPTFWGSITPTAAFAAQFYYVYEDDIRDKDDVQNGRLEERLDYAIGYLARSHAYTEAELAGAAEKLSPVHHENWAEYVHGIVEAECTPDHCPLEPTLVEPSKEFQDLMAAAKVSYEDAPCDIVYFGQKSDGFQIRCIIDVEEIYRKDVSCEMIQIEIADSKVPKLNSFGFYSNEQRKRHEACCSHEATKKPLAAFQTAYANCLAVIREHDHHYELPGRFSSSVYELAEKHAMRKMAICGEYSSSEIIKTAMKCSPTLQVKDYYQDRLKKIQDNPEFKYAVKEYKMVHSRAGGR